MKKSTKWAVRIAALVIAALAFFGMKICENENRIAKIKSYFTRTSCVTNDLQGAALGE